MIKKKHLLALLRNFSLTMEGISQVWAFLQILNLHVFSSTGFKKYMETNDHKCLRDRLTRWRDMWQLLFALRRAIGVIHRISPNSLHCGKCIILHLLWYTWIATQHHWVIHWVAPNSLHIVFFDVSLKQSRLVAPPPVCHLAPSWYIGYHPIWFNAPSRSFNTYSSSTLS